jgi:hypothetical protein
MSEVKNPAGEHEQEAAHPEVKQPPQRVPGEESSKVAPKPRDPRTAEDKDGNESHPRGEQKAG